MNARGLYRLGVRQSRLGNALAERILGAVSAVRKHRLDSDGGTLLADSGELLPFDRFIDFPARSERRINLTKAAGRLALLAKVTLIFIYINGIYGKINRLILICKTSAGSIQLESVD